MYIYTIYTQRQQLTDESAMELIITYTQELITLFHMKKHEPVLWRLKNHVITVAQEIWLKVPIILNL